MLNGTVYTPPPAMSQICGTISGQTISKTKKWTPRERAHFAAEWRLGLLSVTPTVGQAAALFGASVPYTMAAIEDLKADAEYVGNGRLINGSGSAAPVSGIDAAWLEMDEDERKAFVLRHLTTVWDAVESAT
jgi:hypothetical protein